MFVVFFSCNKMCSRKSVVIFLVSLVSLVCGFNLDAENYVQHRHGKSSMFGFTVAMHKDSGNSWVLVGAPEATSSQPADVRRGGAVYRCKIDRDDACQEVPFDRKGHNIDNQGKVIDDKSGQWFGATLNSAGDNGPIVACAPRYVYFASKRDRRDPVGTCYVARGDFGSYSEYSPCRTTLSGYHRQGSCQAGFGAAISKDGNRLFVGGPGSFYWQGQMYSIDAHATFRFTPGKFGGAYGSGQVIQQSLEVRPSVVATKEGSEKDDNSYMGYSVATGDFSGDGEEGVAVGMPRGANLFGKVVLFTWNLTNHQNITGLQLGSYFGYAIAVGDIDGDGTDDLIIGAPLHTENNNEGKYEVGRVYVVYQGRDSTKRFRRLNTLDGFNSKSRFGLSLASLGDINLDGFGDFVVGAPYDGPHERGAVYIYHGSKELASSKYSQVIFAEDVVSGPGTGFMSTFGFSVSGGVDLDGNNYPDMAVGAYLSDSVYFFRSRPVVKIDAYVRFMTANKQIILDEKNCTLRNMKPVTCTSIDVCVNYTGVGVPRTINLDIQYVLDAKNTKHPRLFFLKNENKNVLNESFTLHKDSRHLCNQKIVYIMNDVRDKLTPLEAEVRYSMRESRSFQQRSRNPNSILIPILDMNSPPVRKDSISIHKNCGPDNICIPDLRLIANSSVEKYLLGSNEKLQFEIIVQNEGEDSFESTFDLQMPPGVDFNKIIQYNKTEVRILCSSLENNTIRCDIGNPLPAGKIARFIIQMTPYHKEGMSPVYDFLLTVNSTNPENSGTVSDNQKNIRIPIWVNSHLELGGKSRPSEVHYNASLYAAEEIKRESDIGPQVIHVYTIKNNGPSDINEAEMVFLWPYATLGGEDLLYLLEQPHTIGNVKCEPAQANYRGYDLEFRKKSIWETIGIDVSKGDFSMAAGQTGEIIIEEGAGTLTSSGGEKINAKTDHDYEQSGDGSLIHQQRRKQQQAGGSASSGTIVHVGKDTGSGSEVRVETQSSSWNSSHGGPTVTYTYSKNSTRYIGPDGKVYYHESTSGDPRLAGAHGITHTSSGGSTSGGSFSSSSSTGSQSGHTQISGGTNGGHSSSSGSQSGHMPGGSSGSSSGGHSSGTHSGSGGSYSRESQSGGSYSSSSGSQSGGHITSTGGHSSQGSHISASGTHITSNGGHSTQGGHISASGTQTVQPGSEDGRISSNFGGHNVRPNIIYTSTGKQHGQQGTSFSTSSGSSGSTGGSIDVGYESREEGRRSGQTFRHEDGGHTIYQEGQYPGNKPHTVNKHFDWSRGTSQEDYNYGRSNEGGYGKSEGGNTRYESTRQGGYSGSGYGSAVGREESIQRQESSRNREEGETNYSGNVKINREEETYSRYPDNYDFPYSSEEYTENAAYDEETIRSQSGGQIAGGQSSSEHISGGHAAGGYGSSGYNRSGSSSWSRQGGSTYDQFGNKQFETDYAQHGLGAAALDHGFKTSSIDLGSLGVQNSGGHGAQGSSQWSSGQRGEVQGGSANGAHESSQWSSGQRGEGQQGGSKWESRSESSWSASGSGLSPDFRVSATMIEKDNVATDKPDLNNRFHGRRKRQLYEDIDIRNVMECKSTKCLMVRCTVGPLLNEQDAIIALRSRVNIRALRNISTSQPISFSSMMLARISKLPYIGRPTERQIHSHEIFTTVPAPEPDIKPDIVPLWVVVLAAVAGTVILLLLIFLLYKMGFFKRNRPSDAPERQPLNRNGYYQNGDAAL